MNFFLFLFFKNVVARKWHACGLNDSSVGLTFWKLVVWQRKRGRHPGVLSDHGPSRFVPSLPLYLCKVVIMGGCHQCAVFCGTRNVEWALSLVSAIIFRVK